MNVKLRAIEKTDAKDIIDIFNYYVKNSMAAYLEKEVPYAAFEMLIGEAGGYPNAAAVGEDGKVIGFGLLRPYHKFPAFAHTAEASYFISPEYTGKGIGTMMLEQLTAAAKEKGIECILASISSENQGSIRFHEKHGFARCGQFEKVGRKNGRYFDVVWMQKKI